MERIKTCTSCELCKNQCPLVCKQVSADVMWVGLSAKKVDNVETSFPLSPDTNSGKVIESIEKKCKGVAFYKTNLVKCLPLDKNKKLRYPTANEILSCFKNLELELEAIKPKLVFMLGNNVASAIEKNVDVDKFKDIAFQKIEHPSYIYVYKRKTIEEYENKVIQIIQKNIKN